MELIDPTAAIEACCAEPAAHRRRDGLACRTHLSIILVQGLDDQIYRLAGVPQLKAVYLVLYGALKIFTLLSTNRRGGGQDEKGDYRASHKPQGRVFHDGSFRPDDGHCVNFGRGRAARGVDPQIRVNEFVREF